MANFENQLCSCNCCFERPASCFSRRGHDCCHPVAGLLALFHSRKGVSADFALKNLARSTVAHIRAQARRDAISTLESHDEAPISANPEGNGARMRTRCVREDLSGSLNDRRPQCDSTPVIRDELTLWHRGLCRCGLSGLRIGFEQETAALESVGSLSELRNVFPVV